MSARRTRACSFVALALATGSAFAAAVEEVRFDSRDVDPAGGRPVTIEAAWAKPGGAGPFPAVVALHGCAGLWAAPADGGRVLGERHRAMAAMLVEQGYAVLMPDSFTTRGERGICTQPPPDRRIRTMTRIGDVNGALDWLERRADVGPGRIALLGWSHGGGIVLAMTLERMRDAGDAPSLGTLRAAIAFYPGCAEYAHAPDAYRTSVPLRIFVGDADDWTPAAPCVALGASTAGRGEPVEVTTYAGALHDFDHPGGRLRVLTGMPGAANAGAGVTAGPDPEARVAAWASVRLILRGAIGSPDSGAAR